jgi:hypothetical protein
MKKIINFLICILLSNFLVISQSTAKKKVLILHDELPAMEVLSEFLKQNRIDIDIVDQIHLKHELSNYNAVIMYIHGNLEESIANKVIEYTKKGGRFICLHHSISAKKSIINKNYFSFLGVQLDDAANCRDPELPGAGYVWIEPITLTLVNLNPKHYVTNYKIKWDENVYYQPSDFPSSGHEYPSISLPEAEVYLNHKFTDGREKTILLGLKFFDDRNNQLFMQDRAAWYKKVEDGDVFYFMPGHSSLDFQNSNFSQMILNAIIFSISNNTYIIGH